MPYDESDPADVPDALGTVADSGRGSLPYALIHGESLVACASWALGDAGVTLVDFATTWEGIRAGDEPFVLHDALCPMTPAEFIAACVRRSVDTGSVVVGVRPVTDTVKEVSGGFVGRTVDRDSLHAVASPIVLPAAVVAALTELPSLDFVPLVEALAARFPIEYVDAPPSARRVASPEDIRLLEALTSESPG